MSSSSLIFIHMIGIAAVFVPGYLLESRTTGRSPSFGELREIRLLVHLFILTIDLILSTLEDLQVRHDLCFTLNTLLGDFSATNQLRY